ncbi:MAG: SpoIIE family protein phosphatase [Elainellaceae cyanobacterium]
MEAAIENVPIISERIGWMVESGDKLKLLVVDDESDNLDLLYRTFRQKFTVFRANSAAKALELLEQEGEMAVIISDQRMPFMKGTELLRRTVDQFPDTVRIVLTGYTDVEDLVDAINTGQVFKYITKPWKPQELQDVVQRAADTYRAIKQRTQALRRALRRESVFNAVTQAIRETLDYTQIENAIAHTFGQVFKAQTSILVPISEGGSAESSTPNLSSPSIAYSFSIGDQTDDAAIELVLDEQDIRCLALAQQHNHRQLSCCQDDRRCQQVSVPLIYKNQPLAILILKRSVDQPAWQDDDLQLLDAVAQQAALALSQAKLHQHVQRQTRRMQSELEVARHIQTSLLRRQLPIIEGVALQAHCLPAQEVGGDFYEVYRHPNSNDVWLAVGDVSGKGVPAALLMASAISVLRRELSQDTPPDPGVIMQRLNHSLMDSLVSSNCLITMILARYSAQTSELTYANAGHVYPLLWSRVPALHQAIPGQDSSMPPNDLCEPDYLQERSVPLGITASWQADVGQRSLKAGDVLLLISDGITEASVPEHFHTKDSSALGEASQLSMLRHTGLWQLILEEKGAPNLDAILDHIQPKHDIREDDQTILSMEVL